MRLSPSEQKLVESALPLVQHLAKRAKRRFRSVPFEEFISVGQEALVESVKTFDASRNTPFDVFAFKRVYGAMIRDATTELEGRLHVLIRRAFLADDRNAEPPADLDVEEALEDSPEKARERAVTWARAQAAGMLLTALMANADRAVDGEQSAANHIDRTRAKDALREVMEKLDENERYFVQRFYVEDATLDTIAEELAVVKRTASRLHDRIKTKLAKALSKQGIHEAPPPSSRA